MFIHSIRYFNSMHTNVQSMNVWKKKNFLTPCTYQYDSIVYHCVQPPLALISAKHERMNYHMMICFAWWCTGR